jgi:hypothetical protein
MKSLRAGVFFSASVVGFAFDLLQLPLPPLGRGFFYSEALFAYQLAMYFERLSLDCFNAVNWRIAIQVVVSNVFRAENVLTVTK